MTHIQHFLKIGIEDRTSRIDDKKLKEGLKIIEEHRKECHFFHQIVFFSEHAGNNLIKQIMTRLPNDDSTMSIGTQFPGSLQSPGKSTHSGVTKHQLKKMVNPSEMMNMEDYLSKSYIVFIYSLWEEKTRYKLAQQLSIKKNQVLCDFFGDLKNIRNSIIHDNLPMYDEKIKKNKLLKWYSKTIITKDMLGSLMEYLNSIHIVIVEQM